MRKDTALAAEEGSKPTTAQHNPLSTVMRECKRAFVFVFMLTAATELLSVVPILYMLNLYDRVLMSRSEVTLVSLTLLVFGVYIFWSGLEWIQRRMMVRISLRIDWDLAAEVFDASFRRFIERKKVNVHQVLGDVVNLRQFLTGAPLLALMSAPFALLFIVLSAFFHPYLAIFALVSSVVLLAVTYMTQKVSTPVLQDANNASAEASRVASQSLRQSETALALGMQSNLRMHWHERHQEFVGMQVTASETAGILGSLSGFLTKALPSIQMALGIWLAIEGMITGGMVIAATTLLSKAIGPIQKVLASWKDISNAKQSYERLQSLLQDDAQQASRMKLPAPIGHLAVSQLVMQPGGAQRPALDGIDFKLDPGQVLAVVGPSAAGKSTLVKSLAGIWRPASGSVRLDGAEVCDWALDDLGAYVGYVPQEVEFFEGTIAQNIARMGTVDADKVVKAATYAGMHEAILGFPQGYDTKLSETGFVLTGGQKQRLALARALYGDPCLIVMDEPNASLDELGERSLVHAIRAMKAAKSTIIFTTHRPELLKAADFLLVINGGKQVGFGPVSEMLAQATRKVREARPQPAVGAVAAPPNTQARHASGPGPQDGPSGATVAGAAA